ncbi:MAG: response regulator transcription factor [Anaerolineales bacterium]|nr:response regulator transcription factor [Anaerolineales bacterium]
MSKVIGVLLADDHPTLRLGLRVLLDQAPDVEVIGEAENGEEALALIEALMPDVAVLDCQLPVLEGTRVAQEIRQRGLPVRVLALSAYDDERYVRGMLEAGAVGYLLKEEAPGGIVAAVRAAARGERLWTVEQFARAQRWQEEVEERWNALTEREREVLALVTAGKSNKEIAQTLSITVRTVEFHVSNVLGKLGLTSRVEAAVWAREHGLCNG